GRHAGRARARVHLVTPLAGRRSEVASKRYKTGGRSSVRPNFSWEGPEQAFRRRRDETCAVELIPAAGGSLRARWERRLFRGSFSPKGSGMPERTGRSTCTRAPIAKSASSKGRKKSARS